MAWSLPPVKHHVLTHLGSYDLAVESLVDAWVPSKARVRIAVEARVLVDVHDEADFG